MLRELRVRNLAVVEAVAVPFGPGLNVLTGETGAGKSILLDALLLVAGARGSTELIRAGADAATVEAVFAITPRATVLAVLDDAGLAPEDGELVVRRELSRTGRHRAFVNDSPVTVALLERLGEQLVELHGQHEHQRLLEPAWQLELLDRFADADDVRDHVAVLHAKYRAAREDVDRTRAAARDRAQREDLLRFQVGELDAAGIHVGEEEALRGERRRMQHAERVGAGLVEVAALLDGDRDAATDRLARAARVLHDLGRLDPAFAAPAEPVEAACLQLEEALTALRALREAVVVEPGRLEAIDDRLEALTRLKRKYGDTEPAMLQFRDEAARELDRLARHEEVVAEAERGLEELRTELAAGAEALSERRRTAGGRLAPQVERQLRRLGMDHATFEIAVTRVGLDEMSARGQDRVEFRLCTNPGDEVRPLARVASGGELSRTMLALKAVLARADRVPTMVFDEIDAGIGGRVANVVAEALTSAAARSQVLCVTHLAPIAAAAHHHVRIAKGVRGGRARVQAAVLTGDERVTEIARMLGDEGETARRHARTLLAGHGRS